MGKGFQGVKMFISEYPKFCASGVSKERSYGRTHLKRDDE